ncbi:MAG: CHAD domain-containing protein [Candidatus Binatia bacterium]
MTDAREKSNSRRRRAPAIPAEVEAKLLARQEDELPAIARLRCLGPYRLRPRRAAHLHSVYVDTSNLTLARHGVALRLRRVGGRWEATAKWSGHVAGDVHERPELTQALPRAPRIPFVLGAGRLQRHLAALVGGRRLMPVLVTDIHRRRLTILRSASVGNAAAVAELDLDRVHLHAPAQRAVVGAYYEAEVELLHGTRDEIADLAHLLRTRFGLAPSTNSKFACGMTLLYGPHVLDTTQPRPVWTRDTLAEATRKVIGLQLRRLREHDPEARSGRDIQALYHMCVACHALRRTACTFKSAFPEDLQEYLPRELKWLLGLLESLHDISAELDCTRHYRTRVLKARHDALASFHEYLEVEEVRVRRAVRAALDSARYFRLLIRLEDFTLGLRRHRRHAAARVMPAAPVARAALERAFWHFRERGRSANRSATHAHFRSLQTQAAWLGHLLDLLTGTGGEPERRLRTHLARLQDLLTGPQQAARSRIFVQRYTKRARVAPSHQEGAALQLFLARHDARNASQQFTKAWRYLSGTIAIRDLAAALQGLRTGQRKGAPPARQL